MAKTRRPLEWDDLDLGGTVRLTTARGEVFEGEYLGLAVFCPKMPGSSVAQLKIGRAIQYVFQASVVRKQLTAAAARRH